MVVLVHAGSTEADVELCWLRSHRHAQRRHWQALVRVRRRRRLTRLMTAIAAVAFVWLATETSSLTHSERPVGRPVRPAVACPLPAQLRPMFVRAARQTQMPIGLLVSIAQVESRLSQAARSPAGAIGLLQLMPATAAALHYDPTKPDENVTAGAVYLRQLLLRFKSMPLALSAYNAGPGAIEHADNALRRQTTAYVQAIGRHWQKLAGCV